MMTTPPYPRRRFPKSVGVTAAAAVLGPSVLAAGKTRHRNILFIAVDDLRPEPGCYGHQQIISPHIDRLAGQGTTFMRSYCQVPVRGASRASLLTEYVDIFPSLCELAGLPIPDHLHGKSVVPLRSNPDLPWKEAVFRRYVAGDSVRTDRYLYTEWRRNNGERYERMLYDHKEDPHENINIAENKEHASLVRQLNQMIEANRNASQ